MIKKRSVTRPQQTARRPIKENSDSDEEREREREKEDKGNEDGEQALPLADLIELRKLRKARQGIDASRLNKGDVRKRREKLNPEGDVEPGGLRAGVKDDADDSEEEPEGAGTDRAGRGGRVVKSNNFTGQTNALDVDKHMMAYIEENIKLLKGSSEPSSTSTPPSKQPFDPQEELYRISDKWKTPPSQSSSATTSKGGKDGSNANNNSKNGDEGNVTNSLSMLTAIPEVDLGMDSRLRNIEETEKAKRMAAEVRQERQRAKNNSNDEEHLVASRFYRPNLKQKSDTDIMRDAKLEAMGMPTSDEAPRKSHHERPQMATDEMVMERFKKRMRK